MDLATALAAAKLAAELAGNITSAVSKALEAGRDGISDEELRAFITADDRAKENLASAILEAAAQGR